MKYAIIQINNLSPAKIKECIKATTKNQEQTAITKENHLLGPIFNDDPAASCKKRCHNSLVHGKNIT